MAPSGGSFVALSIVHKHIYALIDTGAHQDSEDVRWVCSGTIIMFADPRGHSVPAGWPREGEGETQGSR